MSDVPPGGPPEAERPRHRLAFLLLLCVVTVAFGWVMLPFYGAIFWAVVIAILFSGVQRRALSRLHRPTGAALLTLTVIVFIVIVPVGLIGSLLAQEAAGVVQRVQAGDFAVGSVMQQMLAALPDGAREMLDRIGLGDVGALQQRVGGLLAEGSRALASRALAIGQNTFEMVIAFFVMLYLLFFLLRDGETLARRLKEAIPLDADDKRRLFANFATVIRATVKGNILIAVVQGALGGIAFAVLGVHGALLWAVLMAFLSLLPAIGAGLVWLPVALWFMATGQWWQGLGLTAWCGLVIGLVDNVLRPILVGKDTRMPDWLVLLSTLGGMSIFGLNGFVIGPVIAAIFIAVWDIYRPARHNAPEERVDGPH